MATDETTRLRSSIVWMRPFTSTSSFARRCGRALVARATSAVGPPPVIAATPAKAPALSRSRRDKPFPLLPLLSSLMIPSIGGCHHHRQTMARQQPRATDRPPAHRNRHGVLLDLETVLLGCSPASMRASRSQVRARPHPPIERIAAYGTARIDRMAFAHRND